MPSSCSEIRDSLDGTCEFEPGYYIVGDEDGVRTDYCEAIEDGVCGSSSWTKVEERDYS